MSCEPVGVISAGRFLNESLPEGARTFIETDKNCLKEVSRVSRWSDGSITAESRNSLGRAKNTVILDSTSLYVAFSDLTPLDIVSVKQKARGVANIPSRLPSLQYEDVDQPYPNYWVA